MATIMTKQGNLDNVVTYEHICDTFEDIQSIDPHYITLGSTCVVINGESGGLEVYMADSNKEWQSISITSDESSSLPIQILGPNDYDENGVPTIESPIENIIYLVPSDTEYTNDIFKEWIYINNSWEQVGGVHINIPTPDWNETDTTNSAYIQNKPSIKSGTGLSSIIEGNNSNASGNYSHAEGISTIANHEAQHVLGAYNVSDPSSAPETSKGTYIEIVGNGTGTNNRSNARTLDWSGNERLAGSLTLGNTTLTEAALQTLLSFTSATGVSF